MPRIVPRPSRTRTSDNGCGECAVHRVRVLIFWWHRVLGEVLAASLGSDPRITVVAVTGDPGEAVRVLTAGAADVALIDASLELSPALDLVRRLLGEQPDALLVPFGVSEAEAALALVEAGAGTYLPSEIPLCEVAGAVVDVMRGARPAPMAFAARVADRIEELGTRGITHPLDPVEGRGRLSVRELEVLESIARGLGNKEIAHRTGIRTATVKNHVHSILQKLGVSGRRDAVRVAYERGLLQGPLRWRTVEADE